MFLKKLLFVTLFVFVLFPVFTFRVSAASVIIVDKNSIGGVGCNDSWPGTLNQPICTINKAQSLISPGGTVYVRGGKYNSKVNITTGNGTSTAPVIYKPYQQEIVVIDGTGISVSGGQALVTLTNLSYVTFQGFEIKNSVEKGLVVNSSNFVTISKNIIHDMQDQGMDVSGTNITVDGNTVYLVVLNNTNGALGSGGWAQAVASHYQPDGTASRNMTFTNNTIYNSWGEGLDIIATDGAQVSGNRIYDTFSVLIYTDNSRNFTIDGNYLSTSNATYYRSGKPATGIAISSESCCRPNPSYPSENITISNNLIVGTSISLQYWLGDFNNPYKNLKVFYNTFKDPTNIPMYFEAVATSGNEMRNNIFYKQGWFDSTSGWTFSNNNWVNGKPSFDSGSSSYSANPSFVNPIANGPADGYKLLANSTSIGKGVAVGVTTDYFGVSRRNPPTVGFYEFSSTSSTPTPSATPQIKVGDLNNDGSVDIIDIGIIINKYGLSGLPGFIPSDINRDGVVNIVDIGTVIDNYGI